MKFFTRFSPFNALIWTACFAVIAGVIAGGIVVFGPVDVLKDWTISVGNEGKKFEAGQTVYFESESIKLLSVEGRADRYLICDTKGELIEREISISGYELKRPAGDNPLRKNAIKMPAYEAFNDESGVSTLPRTCRLHINACYSVYAFRVHCEQAETEKFTVVAKLGEGDDTDNSDEVNYIQEPSGNISQNTQETAPPKETIHKEVEKIETRLLDTSIIGLIPIKLGCQAQ